MRLTAGSAGDRRIDVRSIRVGIGCAIAMILVTSSAQANEYEPSNAGHPLRIAAYALHPIGVVYDYLLLRPAFWVGSHEPFRSLFGRTD